MRLKTLPPAILLALLLTPAIFAQTSPESPAGSGNAYGIEPEKSYPGTVIAELMKAAEDEIDAAVAEAYAEGYKAATARHAPLAESYRALAAETRAKLDAEQKKSRLFWPAIGASSGASLVAGFLVAFFAAR